MRGLVQALQAPPSMRHSKVELPSSALKSKSALVEAVGSAGLESIVVSGASRSIVNVRLDGVSVLATSSTARTRTVYDPSAGKLPAGKASDQSPAESVASFQVSVALAKAVPFQ